MISKLIRLTLCFALFYSAQSTAYNEAMCILIKQEMQQYSNNKASQKYREAARNYKKNCNKPKEIQAQTKPQIIEPKQTIITQPQPQIVEPAPVIEPAPVVEPTTEAAKSNITEQMLNLTNEQKQQINDLLNSNNNNQIVIDADPTKQTNQAVIEPVKPTTAVNTVAQTPQIKPVLVAKPAPTTPLQPAVQSPNSLLLPTLILVIVVLIGAMVLVRLRRAKQSKITAAPFISTFAKTKAEPQTDVEPTVTNTPAQVSTGTVQTAVPNADEKNNVTTQPQEPTAAEPIDTSEQTSAATFTEVKQKPEPNTAEFEAAAKATLERIKNASSFSEPQVRDFDPDAKPIKKQRTHYAAQVAKLTSVEPEHKSVQPVTNTPEPIIPSEPVTNLHTPEQTTNAQTTTFETEKDFKEPQVRTFDPNAPLPSEKPAHKKAKATQASQTDEPHVEPEKTDNSNPFANLSLDSSWDPESTEKPVIEEKKHPPKSQALIDAEERAKKLQTKE
ncbi:possible cell surface anchor [Pseudoalteromonas sp. BSi20652]|uniref:hypothetical protein n=1 Tax=Pseudoalteromonas sp. BSi20652 TaxID=388384 RepID=UPI000231B0D3|nr:hypothetical protein [Pseudoalteromonas sp. BSi20652]GAA62073.1 possible cell surface anchor [Pseudoalteromonas sp. BSi20652]